jgi:hypothetical protein
MFAHIATSSSLSYVLNYNEKKVAHKDGVLIYSSGFLRDTNRLTRHDKTDRFRRLNELNNRSRINMFHAFLHFESTDHLSDEQMSKIADRYMEGIGMQDQPYLVYKHTDIAHSHVHLVSSLIRLNDRPVDTHKIVKSLSKPACKAIEKEFGLAPTDSRKCKQAYPLRSTDVRKVIYGNTMETKQGIGDVLMMVDKEYRFTSLPEYNAVLRQYNVLADRGSEDSLMYKKGGLVYRALDSRGRKVGVPIKASDYHFKPTLANLGKKFEENQESHKADLVEMRQRINWVFWQQPQSLAELAIELHKEGIEVLIRHNRDGAVYDLTYIDHQLKAVAADVDLGNAYRATSILKDMAGQALTPDPLAQSLLNLKVPQILSQLVASDPGLGSSSESLDEDLQFRKKRRRL